MDRAEAMTEARLVTREQLAAALPHRLSYEFSEYDKDARRLVADAIFAALPDHDCLMPSACGVTGFHCANVVAAPAEGLTEEEPLLDIDRLTAALPSAWTRLLPARQRRAFAEGIANRYQPHRAALARCESADDDEFELESVHHGGTGPEGSR